MPTAIHIKPPTAADDQRKAQQAKEARAAVAKAAQQALQGATMPKPGYKHPSHKGIPSARGKGVRTPQGVIRPGQKRPYRKATEAERDERVDWLVQQMIRRPMMSRFQIHKIFTKRYDMDWRTIDTVYINKARARLRSYAHIPQDELRSIVQSTLMDVMEKDKGHVRVAASRVLSEIGGLNAPTRQQVIVAGSVQVDDKRPMEHVDGQRLRELAAALPNVIQLPKAAEETVEEVLENKQ